MPCAKNRRNLAQGEKRLHHGPDFYPGPILRMLWGTHQAQYPYIWSRQDSRIVFARVIERLENKKLISPCLEYPGPKMPENVPLMAKRGR
jgi:hypothetical protein